MGTVIAMRALPGSGKSTFAKQLAQLAQSEGKSTVINFPPDEKSEQEPEQLKFDFAMSKSIHGLLKIATVFERKLKRQNH
jgi:uridine kinase